MATIIFFFLFFLQCRGDHIYNVVINKEAPCNVKRCLTLDEYAKDAARYFTSDTTLRFQPGDHTLNIGTFFEIWNVNNLTLVGADNYTPGFKGLLEPVSRIVCNGNGSEFWNSGFAIIHSTRLCIERLSFSMCGTHIEWLENKLISIRNRSVFNNILKFNLKAALFLVDIRSLMITNVTVSKSFGYGLFGLNVLGASIEGASFTENNLYTFYDSDCMLHAGRCNNTKCIGGNTAFIFEDHNGYNCSDTTYKLKIVNSNFFHGVCVCYDHGYTVAGGGLGVLFGQSQFGIEVDIYNSHMEGNTGIFGGNLYIVFISYTNGSSIKVQGTYLGYGNVIFPLSSRQGGGGIYLSYGLAFWSSFSPMCELNTEGTQMNTFTLLDCEIVHGSAYIGAGAYLQIEGSENPLNKFLIYVEKCWFTENIASNGAAVVLAGYQPSPLANPAQIIFHNTTFYSNQRKVLDNKYALTGNKLYSNIMGTTAILLGAVWVLSVQHLYFSNCTFHHNGLSGLAAWDSNIVFRGDNEFKSNRGFSGGGMGLSQTILYLHPNTHIEFINNQALKRGGGIYVDFFPFESASSCFFQIYDPGSLTEVNIAISFRNNSAKKSGTSLYGGLIDRCFVTSPSSFTEKSSTEVVKSIFHFEASGEIDPVSSHPFDICICTNSSNNYDCDIKIHAIETYSGKLFQIPVVAVGQRNGRAPAVVSAFISADGSVAHLGKRQALQRIQQYCTQVEYTVYSNSSLVSIQLAVYSVGFSFNQHVTTLQVSLKPCPPGFSIFSSLGCNCDPLLLKYGISSCDINTQTILKKQNLWINIYAPTKGLIVHSHCPLDYCIVEEINITLDAPEKQCAFKHSGTLCGACKPGLSLALGTSQCLKCSSSSLGFIALFAVFGILLVLILMLLNLTTAVGTINGLIFYANIIAMNRAIFIPSVIDTVHGTLLSIFIAWLNLDFGIEVCFVNGMDAYIRTWLQFVFPAYIWVLVGLIIIASRYSVTLSNHLATNAVPVLATLFLLSYTKILRTIVAALSFTFLDLPDETREAVWLHDGNVPYFKGKHIALAVFGILVFLLTAIPYTFLLLFGQLLQAVSNRRLFRWVNKLMPFFDAHHAPYENRYRYWTGLLLLVRTVVLVVISVNSTADPGMNLLVTGCAITIVLGISMSIRGAYKKWYLIVLESSFLLNLNVLVPLMFYFQKSLAIQKVIISVSLGAAFATFVGIILLHIVWKTHICEILTAQLKKLAANWHTQNQDEGSLQLQNTGSCQQSFPTTNYIAYRESLIEPQNTDT